MIDRIGELLNSAGPGVVEGAPWLGHAAAAGALLLGLLLWLFGGRAMRPALASLGLAAGAAAGFAVGEGLGATVDTWIATGVGAVAGLLMGVVLFRLTMALTLGAVLGALAPLATATLIHHYGSPLEGSPAGQVAEDRVEETGQHLRNLFLEDVAIGEGLERARRLGERVGVPEASAPGGATPEAPGDASGDAAVAALERAGRFAGALGREVEPIWEEMPVRDRMLLVLSLVTGWAMGLAIGTVLPRSAAALIAAGAGAGMLLASGVWLGTAMGVLGGEGGLVSLPVRPLTWIGLWGLVWVVGAAFQFVVLGRTKKAPGAGTPE